MLNGSKFGCNIGKELTKLCNENSVFGKRLNWNNEEVNMTYEDFKVNCNYPCHSSIVELLSTLVQHSNKNRNSTVGLPNATVLGQRRNKPLIYASNADAKFNSTLVQDSPNLSFVFKFLDHITKCEK